MTPFGRIRNTRLARGARGPALKNEIPESGSEGDDPEPGLSENARDSKGFRKPTEAGIQRFGEFQRRLPLQMGIRVRSPTLSVRSSSFERAPRCHDLSRR